MKKILIALLLIFPFLINGCSCDKFDVDTYLTAVKYYNNSTGVDYKLTKITQVTNSNIEVQEEGTYKYEYSSTKKVINFASVIKKYKIELKKDGTNGNPNLVFQLDRYYKSDENKFYSKDAINDKRNVENITYEEKYDEDSEYFYFNLVPVFSSKNIENFKISKHESKNKYSVATFEAACPVVAKCDENKKITYTVTMDRDFYFNKIEFTTYKTIKEAIEATETTPFVAAVVETTKYTYEFNKFNSDVKIEFPADLANY